MRAAAGFVAWLHRTIYACIGTGTNLCAYIAYLRLGRAKIAAIDSRGSDGAHRRHIRRNIHGRRGFRRAVRDGDSSAGVEAAQCIAMHTTQTLAHDAPAQARCPYSFASVESCLRRPVRASTCTSGIVVSLSCSSRGTAVW